MQDRHSFIETPEGLVVSHLRASFMVRSRMLKKREKGIYKRHIPHVGLKEISRRQPAVEPLQYTYDIGCTNAQGARIFTCIKKEGRYQGLRQFVDVDIAVAIVGRRRPCHFCGGCAEVDTGAMRDDRFHKARCGSTYTIKITACSDQARHSRSREDHSAACCAAVR